MASYTDKIITNDTWVDIYAAVGLATTSELYIQNKSQASLLYYEDIAAPANNTVNGFLIFGNMEKKIVIKPQTGMKVYLKCNDKTATIALMSGQ